MRRATLIRSVGTLCLGAATSVAVSWMLAIKGVDFRSGVTTDPTCWLEPRLGTMEWACADVICRGVGYEVSRLYWHSDIEASLMDFSDFEGLPVGPAAWQEPARPCEYHMPEGSRVSRIEYRFGWPLKSMWAAEDSLATGGCDSSPGRYTNMLGVWPWDHIGLCDGLNPPDHATFFNLPDKFVRCVPTGILSAGAAANTAIYSVPWGLLLFAAPRRIRCAARARRGRCIRCRYDLRSGGLNDCPECGAKRGEPCE